MKKAFSLIEFIIVIFIMSGLLLATTSILITIMAQNNQINIKNDLRNESNMIMDLLTSDIRASKCENFTANSIDLYDTFGIQNACFAGTRIARYVINGSNNIMRTPPVGGSVQINSTKTIVWNCPGCSSSGCSPGFVVSDASGTRSYTLMLSLRQAASSPRSDFCGKIQVEQTLKPRSVN
jgi:prepilin-type N-terminal cleavage/methylation domain-containing protein